MADRKIEHTTISAVLDAIGSGMTASELHGGFCGVLCAGGAGAASAWLEDCAREAERSEAAAEEARGVFHLMELQDWRALASADLEFMPLLPDDDAPLSDRVGELSVWCHGFLAGLGLGGLSLPESSPDTVDDGDAENPVEEIVHDFAAISRAGLSATERGDPNDAEFTLAEIVEYVRVGVQIVFEEIGDTRGGESGLPTSLSEH